jgi:uncharacterized protein YqjF (DUF2071 family)
MATTFLTAEWRKLALANYVIDPKILEKYVPKGTELDIWEGKCFVSLVGFRFLNTKVKGIKVPFHVNFDEVNLRFYVKYLDENEWKRGVVFIKEIVPKPILSFVARTLYGEPYHTHPMKHEWKETETERFVSYSWKTSEWNHFSVNAALKSVSINAGSEEEFITEHYWGYTKRSETKTSEYEVTHPRWEVYPVHSHSIQTNFEEVYGADFAILNTLVPNSVFLAEGSETSVKSGKKIR